MTKNKRRWLGRILIGFLAVLVLLSVAGFGYEAFAERDDARRIPMPGRLVDVGGHRLHLDCTGSGSPTIVFEAGIGEPGASWSAVREELARSARACTYDRAGYAWSEPSDGPHTAQRAADELHTLLRAAGEAGPYLLVGHSYGAHITRLFAARWPGETAGLVLVDPSVEDQADSVGRPILIAQFAAYEWAARVGIVRAFSGALLPADAPAELRRQAPVLYGAASMTAARAESMSIMESAAQVRALPGDGTPWGARPVTVISASGQPPATEALHAKLAALSSRGRHVVADTDDHYVHYARPRLVVNAIQEVAAEIRG
ncbi:alpha/beta fold hydrolase [Nonomuraea sp. NPDC050536]|uniref:alpha/beta fold hydrolase n=1 Tax=Nonomuraea sp. NPDC050536 TaxID=3364366 RepID=UPI0037C79C84